MSSIFLRHKQEKEDIENIGRIFATCLLHPADFVLIYIKTPPNVSVTRHRPCTLFTPVVHFTAHIAEASTIL